MKKNLLNYVYIILFFSAIYLPFILNNFIPNDTVVNNENRVLAEIPDFSLSEIEEYPTKFETYFNDNLPYRSKIINLWRDFNFLCFSESPDEKVIVGHNKGDLWLFYNDLKGEDPISLIDGRKKYDENELMFSIKNMKKNTEKFADRGIDLYYAIIPDKSTIYTEYLPSFIDVKKDEFLSVRDYIKENGINNFYYPYDLLMSNKDKNEIYFRTDTHWNQLGSYIFAKEFISNVYDNKINVDAKVNQKIIRSNEGDLTKITGLGLKLNETKTEFEFSNKPIINKEVVDTGIGNLVIYNNSNYLIDETLMLVGDSYTQSLVDILPSIYKKVVYLYINHNQYDEKYIDMYKPDKVLMIRVERLALQGLNYNFFK